jgi:tRNA pseudouridine55 synthase
MTDGYFLLDKPCGVTSFEALYPIKRALGTGKVGHTGTLDKFASGLMIVLTGRALKQSAAFSACDKRYEGTICFGLETDTLDPEGAPVAEAPPPSREALEAVLPAFSGPLLQTPPKFSAIHVNGKRAHELARSGVDVVMKQRPVTVYAIELLSYESPFARIAVHCSSGTYIRSLARDIALAAASRAHLSALRRTQVGGFRVEDAFTACGQPPEIIRAAHRPQQFAIQTNQAHVTPLTGRPLPP